MSGDACRQRPSTWTTRQPDCHLSISATVKTLVRQTSPLLAKQTDEPKLPKPVYGMTLKQTAIPFYPTPSGGGVATGCGIGCGSGCGTGGGSIEKPRSSLKYWLILGAAVVAAAPSPGASSVP